jgi:D-alanyl-D-alanine carboxypeptidase/D-alanyl-D-alanine-endopeptidase (penicillin-binding protein 4)
MVNDELAGEGRGRAVVDALVDWVARSGAVPVPVPTPAAAAVPAQATAQALAPAPTPATVQ